MITILINPESGELRASVSLGILGGEILLDAEDIIIRAAAAIIQQREGAPPPDDTGTHAENYAGAAESDVSDLPDLPDSILAATNHPPTVEVREQPMTPNLEEIRSRNPFISERPWAVNPNGSK